MGILTFLVFWIFTSIMIHLVLMRINLEDKICLNVKLKKPQRYITKVNPIYELFLDQDDDLYEIFKYSLTYVEADIINLFILIFIPYPVYIFKYRYKRSRWSITACKSEDILTFDSDLKEWYETKMAEEDVIEQKEKEEKNKVQNKVNEINKIFNENYEK